MRILIAAAPKTGNVWVKKILAETYGLTILPGARTPKDNPTSFKEFIDCGLFRDNMIFHQHFMPSPDLFELASSIGCYVVSTLRNPYDSFASLYYYVQSFKDNYFATQDPAKAMIGKPIDDRAVLEFLAEGYADHLFMELAWAESEDCLLVRYEDLHAKPFQETKRLTDRMQSVDDARISKAVSASNAQSMRSESDTMRRHIRNATVGDWKNHLQERHLAVFRSYYSEWIRRLGYQVL